ncbi:uncharacterized protein LOC144745768 [Ciona intestinalis]
MKALEKHKEKLHQFSKLNLNLLDMFTNAAKNRGYPSWLVLPNKVQQEITFTFIYYQASNPIEQSLCFGEAYEAIKSCVVIKPAAKGFEKAISILHDQFGQRHQIVKAHLNVLERFNIVQGKRLCFNCLAPGHSARFCRNGARCQACNFSHHTLLHIHPPSPKPPINNSGNEVLTANAILGGPKRTRFPVVPVEVWSRDRRTSVRTYAFLNNGASHTMCKFSLLDKLNPRATKRRGDTKFVMKTLNHTEEQFGCKTKFSVKGIYEREIFHMKDVWVISKLPDVKDSIPSSLDVQRYEHLKGLHFPDLNVNEVELLIGSDCDVATEEIARRRMKGCPTAVRTRLGWTLNGPENNVSNIRPQVSINYCKVGDTGIHEQLEHMFSYDFCESKSARELGPSVEDCQALSIMEKSCSKTADGHCEISLPWKPDKPRLPNNRSMAENRLSQQERFVRDPELYQKYKAKMNEYLENGHARIVPDSQPVNKEKVWYIPHHSTKGKFRVVFDCAARFGGTSLNDQLLQWPDFSSNLVGVLIRFRQDKIAFTADIKGMFHQVRVHPQDCDSLRFLWWPNDDIERKPVDHQMLVHIFGATSSLSCAGFALKRVAK